MKILHVSHSDIHGGASIAMLRLHKALNEYGIESTVLVGKKKSHDSGVLGPQSTITTKVCDLRNYLTLPLHIYHGLDRPAPLSFNILPSGLHNKINQMDVDVVNLHWICRETISISEIAKIKCPIVWTLHDMWPFIGVEHYAELTPKDMGNYLNLRNQGRLGKWAWKRKLKNWTNKSINVISPSTWLSKYAESSPIFANSEIETIPNCVDIEIFKPMDKTLAKKALGLNVDKKYILFGALSSTSEPRKGFKELTDAIKILSTKLRNTELLVFGSTTSSYDLDNLIPTHYLGSIHKESSIAALYNASDIFVAPSLQDNLPNTIMEALACGTPCVAFRVGGIQELISHGYNGLLAPARDSQALGDCIFKLLVQDSLKVISANARSSAEARYSPKVVSKAYECFYSKILKKTKDSKRC